MKKIFTFLLSLSCTAVMAQNINGDFDTWRSYQAGTPPTNLEAPIGWYGTDSILFTYGPFLSPATTFKQQLTKTANSHTGAFAAQIMSHDQGPDFGLLPGLLVNSMPTIDPLTFDPNDPFGSITFEGGLHSVERINEATAWIKYEPRNSDMGEFSVFAYLEGQGSNGEDSLVGLADTVLDRAYPSFTEFKIRVQYINATVVPDKIIIGFISSSDDVTDSSVMYVDDASVLGASGVRIPAFQQQVVKVYPSPASQTIYLTTTYNKQLNWQAYSMDGKMVANIALNKSATVDVSQLSAGSYIYRVLNESGQVIQQQKFVKQ